MNCKELLSRRQALRDQIWIHGPEHFDMGFWFSSRTNCTSIWQAAQVNINSCGTTACIAGHGALIMAKKNHLMSYSDSYDIGEYFNLSNALFYTENWVDFEFSNGNSLEDRYNELCSEGNYATAEWQTVVAYLDDLIKNMECPDED